MNKGTNENNNHEMLDDYSEMLEGYDFSKATRGKYYQRYSKDGQEPKVKITSKDGDRHVTMRTIKAKATITHDGKLTAHVGSNITPGQYQVTLIIEEPTNSLTAQTSSKSNEGQHNELEE